MRQNNPTFNFSKTVAVLVDSGKVPVFLKAADLLNLCTSGATTQTPFSSLLLDTFDSIFNASGGRFSNGFAGCWHSFREFKDGVRD